MTNHDIVPVHLAVQAMRDSGYKNAAYAIAELIDNSIQAGATHVELLISERQVKLNHRMVKRLDQVAVLDNGSGMNREILRMALQFGNGSYLDRKQWKGIGRFGMGLPNSSISQAERVEVWTWDKDTKVPVYSYLDIEEIKEGKLKHIPEPTERELPDNFKAIASSIDDQGTLVLWSRLDRCMWKKGSTVIDNSEKLIGRIYRRFIVDNRVKIRMAVFDENDPKKISHDKYAVANDPLYLMSNTSCPEPWHDKPMFKEWSTPNVFVISISEEKHEVVVKYSIATPKSRTIINGLAAGHQPHGNMLETMLAYLL